jgi:hypothetical protein
MLATFEQSLAAVQGQAEYRAESYVALTNSHNALKSFQNRLNLTPAQAIRLRSIAARASLVVSIRERLLAANPSDPNLATVQQLRQALDSTATGSGTGDVLGSQASSLTAPFVTMTEQVRAGKIGDAAVTGGKTAVGAVVGGGVAFGIGSLASRAKNTVVKVMGYLAAAVGGLLTFSAVNQATGAASRGSPEAVAPQPRSYFITPNGLQGVQQRSDVTQSGVRFVRAGNQILVGTGTQTFALSLGDGVTVPDGQATPPPTLSLSGSMVSVSAVTGDAGGARLDFSQPAANYAWYDVSRALRTDVSGIQLSTAAMATLQAALQTPLPEGQNAKVVTLPLTFTLSQLSADQLRTLQRLVTNPSQLQVTNDTLTVNVPVTLTRPATTPTAAAPVVPEAVRPLVTELMSFAQAGQWESIDAAIGRPTGVNGPQTAQLAGLQSAVRDAILRQINAAIPAATNVQFSWNAAGYAVVGQRPVTPAPRP